MTPKDRLEKRIEKLQEGKVLNVNKLNKDGIGSITVDESTTSRYFTSVEESKVRANTKDKVLDALDILGITDKTVIGPAAKKVSAKKPAAKKVSAKKPAAKKVSAKGKAPVVTKKVSDNSSSKKLSIPKEVSVYELSEIPSSSKLSITKLTYNGIGQDLDEIVKLKNLKTLVKPNSILRKAINHNQLKAVKFMTKKLGVDASVKSNIAIIDAAEIGDLEMVKYLLTLPGVVATDRGNEAIATASENGNIKMVKFLMKLPGVNAFDSNGLEMASNKGHIQTAKALAVLPGVNSAIHNKAIIAAIEGNNIDIVKYLLTFPDTSADIDSILGSRRHYLIPEMIEFLESQDND